MNLVGALGVNAPPPMSPSDPSLAPVQPAAAAGVAAASSPVAGSIPPAAAALAVAAPVVRYPAPVIASPLLRLLLGAFLRHLLRRRIIGAVYLPESIAALGVSSIVDGQAGHADPMQSDDGVEALVTKPVAGDDA